MKKIKLLLGIVLCTALISCNEIKGILQMINCTYNLDSVVKPTIAGVSLSSITNPSQLNVMDVAKIALAFSKKNFPISLTVDVKATNPGNVEAKIQQLDWAMDLEQNEILHGSINQIISVPASGGSALIPFTVTTDLLQLFSSETKDNLLNLALNIANVGDSSSKVSLRVRPTIVIGGQPLSTGFITLSKTVSSK
jgi:LEA14-like dessication related protein